MSGTVQDRLDQLTAPGFLYEKEEDGALRCFACAHRCRIKPGQRGICKVRFNQDGELRVPWGYVAALQVDPIEKKPFSHFLPGADALSFGMLGCDFHCGFCQNWLTSQTLRDPKSDMGAYYVREIASEEIVRVALKSKAQIVVSTYNEPLITTEWSLDIFKQAKAMGLYTGYVSNGYATPEVLEELAPYLDAYKIDLKSMQAQNYKEMGGKLEHVLETIMYAKKIGLWVEVVTLVIPEMNDSTEELWDTARYIASVSNDIPWHVTAFHPDYQMTKASYTPASTLQVAAEIGQEAGLDFVYAGNLPGRVGSLENTFCPHCNFLLITRSGYRIREYRITSDGNCPKCGKKIPGIWTREPQNVRLDAYGSPRRV